METSMENKLKPTGYLQLESGNEKGHLYALSGVKIFIGRNRNADIKLFTPAVSRNHCTLKFDNGTWYIMDNNSFNGIYINKKKVTPSTFHPLKHEQRIYFGPPENSDIIPHCFTFMSNLDRDLKCKDINTEKNEERNLTTTDEQSCTQNGTPRKSVIVTCSPEKSGKKRKPEEELSTRTNVSDDSIICKRQKTSPIKISISQPSHSNEHVSVARLNTPILSSPSLKEHLALIKLRLEESDKIQERVQQTLRDSEACLNQSWKHRVNLHLQFDEIKKKEVEDNVEDQDSQDSQSLLTKVDECYLESEPYPFSQPLLDDIRFCSQDSSSSTAPDWETSQNHETVIRNLSQERLPTSDKESKDHEGLREKLEIALKEKKELQEKHESVKKEEQKLRNELEHAKNNQQMLKSEVMTQFGEIMEVEFTCGICTELFIRAVTLECSHTFCEKCISEWKKKKRQCPICRTKVTGETRALVIDNFIDKMVTKLSPDYQERRKLVVEDRLKDPVVPKPAQRGRQGRVRGRGRTLRSISPSSILSDPDIVLVPDDSNDSLLDFPGVTSPAAETWRAVLGALTERDSDSESSLEGYGYYGGYGRCFNCGRRGHWANGCPDP